jgi:hypothetical protein
VSGERMVPMTEAQRDEFANTLDYLGHEDNPTVENMRALVAAFDAAPASDPRFAQIRDLLDWHWQEQTPDYIEALPDTDANIYRAWAIASAAAAGERGDDG